MKHSILIATEPDDLHAFFVHLALRNLDQPSCLWFGSDFPSKQGLSHRIGECEDEVRILQHGDAQEECFDPENADIVWCRRIGTPQIPEDALHPADLTVARKQAEYFARSFWMTLPRKARWINPYSSRLRATAKPLQLRLAQCEGLKVPLTLFSNEPKLIREFLASTPNDVVFKAFYAHYWKTTEGFTRTLSNIVREEDLPDDEVLRMSPGIFQHRVPSRYELRVTIMGRHVIAAKLTTSEQPQQDLDWRGHYDRLRVEPYELPSELQASLLRLMDQLGLVFACIDLIVTPDGDYYFLEVNEMGQFLFLEACNPEIRLLRAFVLFLLDRQGDSDVHVPGYEDLAEVVAQFKDSMQTLHVTKENTRMIVEA